MQLPKKSYNKYPCFLVHCNIGGTVCQGGNDAVRPIIQRHKSQYKRYHPFRKYGLLFVILDNTAYTLYLRRAAGLDGRIAVLRFAQRSVKYLEEALAGQGRIQPMRRPV